MKCPWPLGVHSARFVGYVARRADQYGARFAICKPDRVHAAGCGTVHRQRFQPGRHAGERSLHVRRAGSTALLRGTAAKSDVCKRTTATIALWTRGLWQSWLRAYARAGGPTGGARPDLPGQSQCGRSPANTAVLPAHASATTNDPRDSGRVDRESVLAPASPRTHAAVWTTVVPAGLPAPWGRFAIAIASRSNLPTRKGKMKDGYQIPRQQQSAPPAALQ